MPAYPTKEDTMTQATEVPVETADGRQDFDFLHGDWRILNRKLENPLAEDPGEWLEFEATMETRPILGGLGCIDTYSAPDFPGRPGFHGFGLRLFDPNEKVWRIWWASTVGDGHLDPPDITSVSAVWEQSFSFDDGATWDANWTTRHARVA
jgi:hypothetical protein